VNLLIFLDDKNAKKQTPHSHETKNCNVTFCM